MINASVFPQADIRNYLSIYKTLIIAPPLEGCEDEFLSSLGVKLDELIELVMLGRINFVVPQSIDR
ncbi:hypothetical protein LL037_18735 [Clostridium estertheticum]|uniref:hypothetical protein n=1 Tax=Clostridium estertheticum TaxID=238834 RepID=UPI001C0B2D14|nr:hypothetical protein [Clostridium estertheticum]MBU3198506.1 hypothetical protein [Clostridium estertheticum]WAG64488.1 hypothetical protein LL037_18735 [Clostridium estertheticum]